MHHLLRKQLAAAHLDTIVDDGLATFVSAVDRTYREADQQCARLERALDRVAMRKRPHGGVRKILVVEQDAMVRGVVCHLLERAGHEVLDTGDPCEAVAFAALTTEHISALVTAVTMPALNGRQLYDAVSANRPELKVLYISAFTADMLGHCGIAVENAPILRKPFRPRELLRAVGAL